MKKLCISCLRFYVSRSFFLVSFTLLFLSVGLFGQINSVSKKELVRLYTQSIGDFITAASTRYSTHFDTLYFGKHVYGQPDDFPDINLPSVVNGTRIKLVTPEEGSEIQKRCASCVYINLMGWSSKNSFEFLHVVFSHGFSHQFDCSITYSFRAKQKRFVRTSIAFKDFAISK